jgi:hypothetical protein
MVEPLIKKEENRQETSENKEGVSFGSQKMAE